MMNNNKFIQPFYTFLLNNYYTPLTIRDFSDILEEWWASNEDLAEEYGNVIGEVLAEDIMDNLDLKQDTIIYMDFLADYFPYIYEYAIAKAHYDYLVLFFANHIKNDLEKAND